MPYAELPGAQLWYEDSGGSGVPAVFMHAASGSCPAWAPQLPDFTAAGYRCIAYDRLGAGRSRSDGSAPRPHASDDLHDLVALLGLDRFHLIATAAGGAGAIDYALSHPDRLRSLVVSDATGGVQDPDYLALLESIRTPEIDVLPVYLRELSASYRGANPEGARRWIEIEEASRPDSPSPRQASRNRVTFALLKTLSVPTLILVGDADMRTPPSAMRLVAAAIPDSRFATVPEAGHAAHWEQPEIWNRTVLEFIAAH